MLVSVAAALSIGFDAKLRDHECTKFIRGKLLAPETFKKLNVLDNNSKFFEALARASGKDFKYRCYFKDDGVTLDRVEVFLLEGV